MTNKVFVAGVGMIPFKKPGTSESYDQMGAQAVKLALADAGIAYEQVQQAYASAESAEDEAPGEFSQYLEWRSEVVLDEDATTARAYWQQLLQGAQVDIATPWLAARSASQATAGASSSADSALA